MTEFLPDGQDGYDWCVDDLLAALDGGPPANFGADLGTLVAELHTALATPSEHMPHPIETAPPADGWPELLDEALATSGNATLATSGNATLATSGNATLATSGNATLATSGNATLATSGNATAETGGETRADDWLTASGYETPRRGLAGHDPAATGRRSRLPGAPQTGPSHPPAR